MGKKKRSRGGRGNQGPGPYHNNGHQQRGRGRRRPMGDRGGPMGDRPPMNDIMEEPDNGEPVPTEPAWGVLELHPNGYGFLRDPKNNYQRERTDPFVPGTMIEKFGLREGVLINGMVQQSRKQQGPRLQGNHRRRRHASPRTIRNVKTFDSLTPINPESWLRAGNRAAAAQPARDGPAHAARQRAAGADRRSAAHRQDDPLAADQPGDRDELSRRQADRAAGRRAARGSHRHAAAA